MRTLLICTSLLLALGCEREHCARAADAGPDTGLPDVPIRPDGYVVRGSFTIRGAAPTAETCAAENIARVRLRVLDGSAAILDEVIVPCADGALVGEALLPWRVRHYGEWAALAPDGSVRESLPVTRRVDQAPPARELELLPADFQPRPAEWGDFRAGGTVYVTGWTGPQTCTALGIATYELTLAPDAGGAPMVVTATCATARTEGGNGVLVVRTEPQL